MRLPDPTGPHKVGLTTLVRDLPPRRVGGSRFLDKKSADMPVLEMDAVVFNVFYPCDPPKGAKVGSPWMDQCVTTVGRFHLCCLQL